MTIQSKVQTIIETATDKQDALYKLDQLSMRCMNNYKDLLYVDDTYYEVKNDLVEFEFINK